MDMLRNTPVNPSKETQALLESLGTAPIRTGIHAYDLVKRNELSYAIVADAFGLKRYTPDVEEAVDISITYEGYIKKQMDQVDKVRKLEEKILPKEWDYTQIKGISLEAQQKLNKNPPSLHRPSKPHLWRIPGRRICFANSIGTIQSKQIKYGIAYKKAS